MPPRKELFTRVPLQTGISRMVSKPYTKSVAFMSGASAPEWQAGASRPAAGLSEPYVNYQTYSSLNGPTPVHLNHWSPSLTSLQQLHPQSLG